MALELFFKIKEKIKEKKKEKNVMIFMIKQNYIMEYLETFKDTQLSGQSNTKIVHYC